MTYSTELMKHYHSASVTETLLRKNKCTYYLLTYLYNWTKNDKRAI